MSQASAADMSICEQSFHFAPPSSAAMSNAGDGGAMLAGIGGSSKASMIFPHADYDAKTLTQGDNLLDFKHQVKTIANENNETKMSENEAFLAYCKQDDENSDNDI